MKNVKMKKAIPILIKINEKGDIERTPLFKNAKDKFILRPKFSGYLRGSEMILFARTPRLYKLGKLEL